MHVNEENWYNGSQLPLLIHLQDLVMGKTNVFFSFHH